MAANKYSTNRHPFSCLVLKSDPVVAFSLPEQLVEKLKEMIKKSHRKFETEVITRIASSLKYEKAYILMQPLAQFSFLHNENIEMSFEQIIKHGYLQKMLKKQLLSLKEFFQKEEGFIGFTQAFPKELWKRLQIKALEHEHSVNAEMSLRIAATLEEPTLFGLAKIIKSYKKLTLEENNEQELSMDAYRLHPQ